MCSCIEPFVALYWFFDTHRKKVLYSQLVFYLPNICLQYFFVRIIKTVLTLYIYGFWTIFSLHHPLWPALSIVWNYLYQFRIDEIYTSFTLESYFGLWSNIHFKNYSMFHYLFICHQIPVYSYHRNGSSWTGTN